MQDSRDLYKILQVSKTATINEIKEAYRRLAREYHPDLHPTDPTAEERFKEICQAYEVLSDSVQRSQYDQGLEPNSSVRKKTGMTPQDFYVRALSKALGKDYQGAMEDYNQAIERNPNFVEAYIKRGETRYKLGDARGTLTDCSEALRINPNLADAYYYQGRARYRLGYTQAAIEAYNQAIAKEADFAQAYYHRGLANNDLQEIALAIEDLQKAAELFNEQGDRTGYQLAQQTIHTLKKTKGKQFTSLGKQTKAGVQTLLVDTLFAYKTLALNPTEGLLTAFANLDKKQALFVGILFAIIADFCFVVGAYVISRDLSRVISILNLILVGLVPFVSLFTTSTIVRAICRRRGSLSGDIFLAGASMMPLSFLVLLSSISKFLPNNTMLILSVFVSCYTILTLYSGCTQISNLPEKVAAFVVPVMLLVSGWFSYFAFSLIVL
ncbi:MAG: DnaJ domain-containing protein [Potamolinea sp.]